MSPSFDAPKGIPRQWVRCRGSNHWMDSIPSPPEARRNGVIPVWWRCQNCTTERHDEHDPTTLELVSRRYVYPDGYLMTADNAPTRIAWKATYLQLVGAISSRQASSVRRYHKALWEENNG